MKKEDLNPMVSIIVPVYNVEKYIKECLESLINQTYKNIEILLIDDGSTDSSGKICDEYALKNSRIKVIHKENEGQSQARNVAMKVAGGEYFAFVDSDDWIDKTMIEKLVIHCVENNSQMAMCGRYMFFDATGVAKRDKCPLKTGVLNAEDFLKKLLLSSEGDFISCDKLYHRSLWDSHQFPVGKIYEDMRVLYKLIAQTTSVSLVAEPLYYYRIRKGSSTTTFNSQILETTDIGKKIYNFVKENFPNIQKEAFCHYIIQACNVVTVLERQEKKIKLSYDAERKSLIKELRKNLCFILFNRALDLKIKIKCVLILTQTVKIFYLLKRECAL